MPNYLIKYNYFLLRCIDIFLSIIGIICSLPIMLILLLISFLDTGSPIFLQQRLGKDLKYFTIIKFRTMDLGTASVGTHLVNKSTITNFGKFLRATKLDELPQLINVFIGTMSIVGPRPCLSNQETLIRERKARQIFSVRPGITGLAQVHHINMSTPRKLAKYDQIMIENLNPIIYFKLIFLTIYNGLSQIQQP